MDWNALRFRPCIDNIVRLKDDVCPNPGGLACFPRPRRAVTGLYAAERCGRWY